MMKKIYNILAAGAFALMTLNSCDEPYAAWEESKGEGQLSTKDFVISVKGEEGTRAVRDVNDFIVKITKLSTVSKDNSTEDGQSWTYKYGEMPGVITLNIGDYKLAVYNEDPQDAAWDAPYFYKDTTFTILRDKLESLGEMVCKLCNVKVTVKYDAKLRALLGSDAKVTAMAENNPSKSLVYELEHADNETPGYFKYEEGSKSMVIQFSGTVKGNTVKAYDVRTNVNPGEHHIVTFSLKDTPGIPGESGYIGGSGLSINTTVTVVNLNTDVDPGNDPLDPYETLTVSKNKVSVKAEGGEADFTVSAKGGNSWYITGVPEWLTLTPASGMSGTEELRTTTVTLKAEANPSNETRTATINVRMARNTQVVTVTQLGNGAPEPADDMPTITSETVELNTPIDISGNTDNLVIKVDLKAPNGFKNIFVEIDSDTLTPDELEDVGLAANFDLANPGQFATKLGGLGFPVGDKVLGQTETSFDISGFIVMLKALGPGTSTFIITAVDSKEQSVTEKLILDYKE